MDIGMPELIEVDSLTARVKLCAGLGLEASVYVLRKENFIK